MDTPRPRNAVVAIDLLRFAAALMVVLHHYFGDWSLQKLLGLKAAGQTLPSNAWLHSGWVGVEIFFVVSGYVIALSAANASAGDFVRRRVLRLWPGALVCATLTALTLLVCGLEMAVVGPRYLASALLWPSPRQIDPVYWTLGIECSFYGLAAMLLAFGRWNAVKVAVGLSIWSLAYWAYAMGVTGVAQIGVVDRLAELSLARFGAFFALGMLIQQWHCNPASIRSWMWAPALIVAPVCISWHAAMQGGPAHQPLTLFAASVAVIFLSNRLQPSEGQSRLFRHAITLGVATYPLYLLHQYVGEALLLAAASYGIPPSIAVGPVILIMIGLAIGVANHIEPVLRAQLNLLLRRRPGQAVRLEA